LIDADNFKEVNDRYGHDVGDKILVEMARRLSSSIRHSDVLVRWERRALDYLTLHRSQ
jgi:diguanylate cyclase (GGDEF)-like protein